MGRSKNRTRTERTNRRLRSDLQSSAHTPAPVGYAKLLNQRDLQSPLTFNNVAPQLSRSYAGTDPQTPRQPSRSNGRAGRFRGALSTGVWAQIGEPVREPPEAPRERQTMVCVARQQRREVLHAFRKTGKGGQKSPVYDWRSKIYCKKR